MKNSVQKTFLFIGSILLTLLFLETFLPKVKNDSAFLSKAWISNGKNSLYVLDDERIYRANELKTCCHDSDGYKKNIDKLAQPKITITTIGDSFTYGITPTTDNQTYPFYLQKVLRSKGFSANVNNAGVSGYGTDQEYLFAQSILKKDPPDILIWNLYVNDEYDSNIACLFKKSGSEYQQISAKHNLLYFYDKLPEIMTNLNIVKIIHKSLSSYLKVNYWDSRYTFGCSKPNHDNSNFDLFSDKIAWQIAALNKKLKNSKTKIVYVYMPIQLYFDTRVNNTKFDEATGYYRQINTLKKHTAFLDLNQEWANIYNSNLFHTRNDQNQSSQLSEVSPNIFNAYFMSEEDLSSPIGLKHPSPTGNLEIAKVVADYLSKNYIHD